MTVTTPEWDLPEARRFPSENMEPVWIDSCYCSEKHVFVERCSYAVIRTLRTGRKWRCRGPLAYGRIRGNI